MIQRFRPRALLMCAALLMPALVSSTTIASEEGSGIQQLTSKLQSNDFRLQVQAALILGKTGDGRALPALIEALDDKSVAVRAAAAAALSTLGDPAALPALQRRVGDSNESVRRRIEASIALLEKTQVQQIASRRTAKVLVKIDGFESRAGNTAAAAEALGTAAQQSRRLLEKMPHVAVLNASEEPQIAAARHQRPVVVVRASLSRLATVQEGAETMISANVDFLVEAYPEQSIVGRLSGNASAKSQAETKQARLQLQEEVVGAAVSSALRSGQPALLAAAGRS